VHSAIKSALADSLYSLDGLRVDKRPMALCSTNQMGDFFEFAYSWKMAIYAL